MVVHRCNLRTGEAEVGSCRLGCPPWLHSKSVPQDKQVSKDNGNKKNKATTPCLGVSVVALLVQFTIADNTSMQCPSSP